MLGIQLYSVVSLHKGPVMRNVYPDHDVIMTFERFKLQWTYKTPFTSLSRNCFTQMVCLASVGNPLWNQDDLTTGLLHNWTSCTCNIFILQWATSFCGYLVPAMSVLKVELTSINDGSVTHAWLLLGSTVIATCSYGNGGILTLWHENAFRITGPLWGEFTGNRRFPLTNGQSCRVLVFSLLLIWISCRTNSRVTVMTWWRHCNGTRQIF